MYLGPLLASLPTFKISPLTPIQLGLPVRDLERGKAQLSEAYNLQLNNRRRDKWKLRFEMKKKNADFVIREFELKYNLYILEL